MVCGACFEDFIEAPLEIGLFLIAKDAAREACQVVWSGEEASYSWDVDDIRADIQGEWEGKGFHFKFLLRG